MSLVTLLYIVFVISLFVWLLRIIGDFFRTFIVILVILLLLHLLLGYLHIQIGIPDVITKGIQEGLKIFKNFFSYITYQFSRAMKINGP